MARPKSSIENLKLFQINIRVTLNEQIKLEESAKVYGISLVEYIRRKALQSQLPKSKVTSINRALFIELSRIGNNVNQLTKKVNQNNTVDKDLKDLLFGLQTKLNQIKIELLK